MKSLAAALLIAAITVPVAPSALMAAGTGADPPLPDVYTFDPPDVVDIEIVHPTWAAVTRFETPIKLDGRIALGVYGKCFVAGLTLDQASAAAQTIVRRQDPDAVVVVAIKESNSRFAYVVFQGFGRAGEDDVARVRLPYPLREKPHVGSVLRDLPYPEPTDDEVVTIWLRRHVRDGTGDTDLPVVLEKRCLPTAATNYALRPDDRVFVRLSTR